MHFALLTLSVLPLLVEGKIATVGTIGDYRFLDVAQCVVPCYCLRFPSFPKADVAGEVSSCPSGLIICCGCAQRRAGRQNKIPIKKCFIMSYEL